MELITYNIIRLSPDMCRIVSNDIRQEFKAIADGGCISSLEIMLEEMERITQEVREKHGKEVIFKEVIL